MAIDLEICSTALVLVGGSPITSVTGSGAQETACRHLYPSVVNDVASTYRWRFCQRQVILTRLDEEPESVYWAAYLIPVNTSNVWAVKIDSSNVTFDRFENKIFCDAYSHDEVVAEITELPSEAFWPGYFRTLIELRLAAALAIPIAEDPSKTSIYDKRAEIQFARAKNLDSQMRTAPKMDMGGLRRYHGGRP